MSYDLALWKESAPIPSLQAAATYAELCDGNDEALLPTPDIQRVYSTLSARYPEIDTDERRSPWAARLRPSNRSLVLAIRPSRAAEIAAVVMELATAHELVCFDPQRGVVFYPTSLATRPHLRLEFANGDIIDDPTDAELERAIRSLSTIDWFVSLEVMDGFYIQAGFGTQANAPIGTLALEYRDGSETRHFRTIITNRNDAVVAFQRYARGDAGWKSVLRFDQVL